MYKIVGAEEIFIIIDDNLITISSILASKNSTNLKKHIYWSDFKIWTNIDYGLNSNKGLKF